MTVEILQVIAWPLTVLLIALALAFLFRSELRSLINRIRRARIPGSSIDFGDSETVAKQQEKGAPDDVTKPATVPAAPALLPSQLPPPSPLYAPLEQEIQKWLSSVPQQHRELWLIRLTAINATELGHERVYRLISGSQIGLILQANSITPPTSEQARQMYENAKSAWPDWYANFPFETWINFPLNMKLLYAEAAGDKPTIFKITPRGRDFLEYLLKSGLTFPKMG
jgi:hypothetical protein